MGHKILEFYYDEMNEHENIVMQRNYAMYCLHETELIKHPNRMILALNLNFVVIKFGCNFITFGNLTKIWLDKYNNEVTVQRNFSSPNSK